MVNNETLNHLLLSFVEISESPLKSQHTEMRITSTFAHNPDLFSPETLQYMSSKELQLCVILSATSWLMTLIQPTTLPRFVLPKRFLVALSLLYAILWAWLLSQGSNFFYSILVYEMTIRVFVEIYKLTPTHYGLLEINFSGVLGRLFYLGGSHFHNTKTRIITICVAKVFINDC